MKKYEYYIQWDLTERCNYDCKYCSLKGKKNGKIKPINIKKILKVMNKTGKVCRIGFAGGEPFMCGNLAQACVEISKKHYISLITNLSHPHFKEFVTYVPSDRVIEIMCSAHVEELIKREEIKEFCRRVKLLIKLGYQTKVFEVGHPSFIGKTKEYKKMFKEHGVELKFDRFNGEYNGKFYPNAYTDEELKEFELTRKYVELFYKPNKRICPAGKNFCYVDTQDRSHPCYNYRNERGRSIYKKIKFEKERECPFPFCDCPMDKWEEVTNE